MLNERIKAAADYIFERIQKVPETVIVLGSGLGGFADNLEESVCIPYKEIPHFPVSTVVGHKGMLVSGTLHGKNLLMMQGRFHYYEGYTLQELVFPIQVFAYLGVKNLILTCAVGAINTAYQPGDLVLICDHIKFFIDSPLRGENPDFLGNRFFDLSNAYDKRLRQIASDCANRLQISLQEGVYAHMGGPNFETPAEIRALRIMGADMVGMSTVPEAIAANHAGLAVLGIACCSNMAAGILEQPLTHEEVVETGNRISATFQKLLSEIIKNM